MLREKKFKFHKNLLRDYTHVLSRLGNKYRLVVKVRYQNVLVFGDFERQSVSLVQVDLVETILLTPTKRNIPLKRSYVSKTKMVADLIFKK